MRTRSLPAVLLAVALLVLAACAGGIDRDVPAGVRLDQPDGFAGVAPRSFGFTADGDAVLLTTDESGDGALLTVVPAGSPRADQVEVRLDGFLPEAATAEGDTFLVAGWLPGDPSPDAFVVLVVDGAGRVLEQRVVDAVGPGWSESAAVFSPEGTLYVVLDGYAPEGPRVVAVDPATGAVTGSVELDLGRWAAELEYVFPRSLAVSPTGRWLAVELVGSDRERAEQVPLVVPIDADLRQAEAQALGTGHELSLARPPAVADDGTVHAAVTREDGDDLTDVLVTRPGGRDTTRTLEEFDGDADAVAVSGTELWVLDREGELLRVDAADGAVTGSAQLCPGESEAPVVLAAGPDGTVYAAAVCEGAAHLWVLAPEEAPR
ncbi:hypothetical protein ACI8AF_16895 [Blastococcus sp. SYSU D00669]